MGREWCNLCMCIKDWLKQILPIFQTWLLDLTLKSHSRFPPPTMLLAKLRLMSTEVVKIRVSLAVSLRVVSWEIRNVYPPFCSPGWTLFQTAYRAVTWRLSSTKSAGAERSTGKCVTYGGDPIPPLLLGGMYSMSARLPSLYTTITLHYTLLSKNSVGIIVIKTNHDFAT